MFLLSKKKSSPYIPRLPFRLPTFQRLVQPPTAPQNQSQREEVRGESLNQTHLRIEIDDYNLVIEV